MAYIASHLTVTGNLVEDPELRYTNNGNPVCNFRIAFSNRFYNKQITQWEDDESIFMTCTAWRSEAKNLAHSARKGMAVTVTGYLRGSSYTDRDGNNRRDIDIAANRVSISLANQIATVSPAPKGGAVGSVQDQSPQTQQDTTGYGGGFSTTTGGFNSSDMAGDPPF